MPSFYFEQVLQTALNGIDQNVTGPVLQLAGVILILSLLYAVYEAYSNGGDVRALGVAGIKYLVLGLVFLNYQQAFRSVNGMFNGVADFIYNTNGIGDVIQNWLNSVSAYVGQQGLSSFWTLVTGAISGLLDVLLILIGLIILPVSYTLFTLAYAMYGSILYLVNHRAADEQRECRTWRKWGPQRLRWLQSDDSLGSSECFVLDRDCTNTVHRQSTCTWGSRKHSLRDDFRCRIVCRHGSQDSSRRQLTSRAHWPSPGHV